MILISHYQYTEISRVSLFLFILGYEIGNRLRVEYYQNSELSTCMILLSVYIYNVDHNLLLLLDLL